MKNPLDRLGQASFLLSILAIGACQHMSYTTLPGELVADSAVDYREVGHFEIELYDHYWLWGYAKASDEKVARAIVEKVREMGGNGVRDLRYRVSFSFLDSCINILASGVSYNRATTLVNGTVVQITSARAQGVVPLAQLLSAADGQASLDVAQP